MSCLIFMDLNIVTVLLKITNGEVPYYMIFPPILLSVDQNIHFNVGRFHPFIGHEGP